MDENALIVKAKVDEKALSELLQRYSDRVYLLCLRTLQNEADAQDAAQEALIRIYLNINKFRGDSSFYTWVFRIAKNACYDVIKKANIEIEDLPELVYTGCEYDPAKSAENEETRRTLAELIGRLEPEFARALVLRDIDGFTYAEIAEIMDSSLGTVKSRVSRARDKLAQMAIAAGLA